MKQAITVLALAMLLAACGGGAPGGGGGTTPGPSPTSSAAASGSGGWVTVAGTTYEFTFGDPPRCNIPDDEGRLNGSGRGVGEENVQVTFSYATAEMSTSGDPSMQIVINVDGEQLWYSAVGFFDTDRGSIGSITVEGDTVMISGTLEDGTDDSISAAFTAEATCDR